jgi:probable phosphoglycerate mutase
MNGHAGRLVVASDLGRTRATAEAVGRYEESDRWREFDLGAWDNLSSIEIRARFPEIDRPRFGSGDFQPEGGERFSSFLTRVTGALSDVADRLDDGEAAVVVTHGGVVQTIVGSILGSVDPAAMLVPSNASLTTIRLVDDGEQVSSYNDDLHLDGDVARPGGTRLRLFRHGKTVANSEGRWFGRCETELTDEGRRQAEALAEVAAPLDAVVSSPLGRARETAAPLAAKQGHAVDVCAAFAEFFFGDWEGRTLSEIREIDPDGFRRIHVEGRDEPRGRTGETFRGVGERMAAAAEELVRGRSGTVGVFTHGGATRALAAHLLGIPFAHRDRLPVPRNTAQTELIWMGDALRISSYNVATHLDD